MAIVGDPDSADTEALLSFVRDRYRPFQIVALGTPNWQGAQVPLLQDRDMVDGEAAAYLCRAFAFQAPVTEPEALWSLLENG